jgi:transcriptional accessory protein Tex/SPT6
VPDAAAALQGARDILAERVAEDAELRGRCASSRAQKGVVRAQVVAGKEGEVSKFQDYYDFAQPLREVPSHRALAIRRGEAEGFLVWASRRRRGDRGAHARAVVGARRARPRSSRSWRRTRTSGCSRRRSRWSCASSSRRAPTTRRSASSGATSSSSCSPRRPASGRWSGSTRASAPA